MEYIKLKGFKPKMKRHKLRRAKNWPVALKQIVMKQLVTK